MIERYHIKTGFKHNDLLVLFCVLANKEYRRLSFHAKKRILERIDKIEKIGVFLRDYKIKLEDIIEYTFIDGMIDRALIRTDFDAENDIIISLSKDNTIITAYLNKKSDNHLTLNPCQYV